MTAEILSVQNEGARHRVTFRFVQGAEVRGPFVEDRPTDEDHQAWVAARAPQPEPDYRAAIRGLLGESDYEALRAALADEGVEVVTIGPASLQVTAPATAPYDLDAALAARVGGSYATIKAKLRAAGFAEAMANFKPEAVKL